MYAIIFSFLRVHNADGSFIVPPLPGDEYLPKDDAFDILRDPSTLDLEEVDLERAQQRLRSNGSSLAKALKVRVQIAKCELKADKEPDSAAYFYGKRHQYLTDLVFLFSHTYLGTDEESGNHQIDSNAIPTTDDRLCSGRISATLSALLRNSDIELYEQYRNQLIFDMNDRRDSLLYATLQSRLEARNSALPEQPSSSASLPAMTLVEDDNDDDFNVVVDDGHSDGDTPLDDGDSDATETHS